MNKLQPWYGYLLAVAAFTLWGFFPLYFKEVAHLSPLEVLANRVIWSLVLLAGLLSLLRYWSQARHILFCRAYRWQLLLATLFIATNWGVYIWAVDIGRIFDASLGYYINPLVNIVLGFLILGERLRPLQWISVALAAIGVVIQLVVLGEIPWIALALALSFGFYGLLHKLMELESVSGLFVETALLLPIAVGFLGYLSLHDNGPVVWSRDDWLLLVFAGPVTVVPLLLFTAATRRVTYSEIGFLQYIAPSILFLMAAFVYHEPFSTTRLITFIFIWSALLLVTVDTVRDHRVKRVNQ